jgi:nucleoid DNA-binding protein
MTKTELIDKIASGVKISRVEAGKALDAVIDSIKRTLKEGK